MGLFDVGSDALLFEPSYKVAGVYCRAFFVEVEVGVVGAIVLH
jgi:hypothetical protein